MAMAAMVKWKTFCRPRTVDYCNDRIDEAVPWWRRQGAKQGFLVNEVEHPGI
jgi:hypothetical protein